MRGGLADVVTLPSLVVACSASLAAGLASTSSAGLLVGGRLARVRRGPARVSRPRFSRRGHTSVAARLVDGRVDGPLLVDLLTSALAGGAQPAAALQAVVDALALDSTAPLAQVSARLLLGADAAVAWTPLLDDESWRPLALTMCRAAASGTRSTEPLHALARDLRAQHRATATETARAAVVRAVLPLGVCFLPAFVLLGIVPALVGLASSVLSTA